MAEVKIVGGGELDGATLQGAATEATLQQLVKALGHPPEPKSQPLLHRLPKMLHSWPKNPKDWWMSSKILENNMKVFPQPARCLWVS